MNRHKQRELTFSVLFSLDQNPTEKPLEDIDLQISSAGIDNEEDAVVIRDRVQAVYDKLSDIDQVIEESMDRWSIDRIAKIELSLLRIAVYDMQYDDVPVQVAVNEAVELAKVYGGDQSPRFVNGVLAQIVKRLS